MLRYIGLYTLCDITFTWFLISWFVARHVLFIIVILSAWFDGPRLITVLWVPELGHYYSTFTYDIFVYLLIVLQVSSGLYVDVRTSHSSRSSKWSGSG